MGLCLSSKHSHVTMKEKRCILENDLILKMVFNWNRLIFFCNRCYMFD